MSGLSRTPGKRVWVNSPPRVRIPPAPPNTDLSSLSKPNLSSQNKKGASFEAPLVFKALDSVNQNVPLKPTYMRRPIGS